MLACLTALALLALAFSLDGPLAPEVPPSTTTGQATLVRAFYSAANALLRAEDDAAVAGLVAPNAVAHLPGREPAGWPALAAYWTTLGRATPGLRLAPSAILVDGDEAAATVEPLVPASPWPDLVVEGLSVPQTATERFRFAQGRIAEYWSAIDPAALPQVLPPLPLPAATGPTHAGLARFALPPHASLGDLVEPGPRLLLARTGQLTVLVDGVAQVRHIAPSGSGWRATARPSTLALRPGDAALIPAGVQHTLRNDTDGPVLFFGVSLLPLDAADALASAPLPDLDRSGDGQPTTVGAAATWLADGFDRCVAASATTLRILTLPLAAGQSLAPHPISGVELLASDQGTVLASQNAARPGSLLTTDRVIVAGEGLGGGTGMSGGIVNPGPEPARLLLVVVDRQEATCSRMTPLGDASAAPAKSPPDTSGMPALPVRFPPTQT